MIEKKKSTLHKKTNNCGKQDIGAAVNRNKVQIKHFLLTSAAINIVLKQKTLLKKFILSFIFYSKNI